MLPGNRRTLIILTAPALILLAILTVYPIVRVFALSFFVTAYSSIADWKAVLDRLSGFEESIDWAQKLSETAPRVEFISESGGTVIARLRFLA